MATFQLKCCVVYIPHRKHVTVFAIPAHSLLVPGRGHLGIFAIHKLITIIP